MKCCRWLATLLVLCAIMPAGAYAATPETDAAGMALFLADGTRQLKGQHEHERMPMASTTKIMTALIALESCSLDESVVTPDEAYGVEGSSIYLLRGETMSLKDLLYGLMLCSGNDAAVSIAVHVAGSVEAFAQRMNARALSLGCENTHFVTPNGLHDNEHYTSAYDLGRIACAAMKNPDFYEIVGTSYYQTTTGDHVRTFKNKNKTLWQYEGGIGVKTGFTKAAGRCLVFAAERGGVLLVGVVLDCPTMWEDAFRLLDAGFDMAENKRLVSADQPLVTLPVEKSVDKVLAVYPKGDILIPLRRDGSEVLDWSLMLPDKLTAPVVAGDTVGTLQLAVDGALLRETPLIVIEDAKRLMWHDWFRQIFGDVLGGE